MTRINGKNTDISDITFAEYLEREGYSLKRIAVEVNGEILKKQDYSEDQRRRRYRDSGIRRGRLI